MSDNLGKDYSVIQEQRVAKLFRASRTPQSGGGKFIKGDILSANFLIECKTTTTPKLFFTVRKEVLDKAQHEAREMGKESAILAFTIGESFEDYFVVTPQFVSKLLDLQDGISDICASLKAQLSQIELRAQELQARQRSGNYEISDTDKISYKIHKRRIEDFLSMLEKLL